MKTKSVLLGVAVSLFVSMLPAWAWDIPGHIMVAQMANDRLNPRAAAKLREIAPHLHLTTSSGTHDYNAVNVAAWADNIKHQHGGPFAGEFKHWHFIDLGCDAADPDVFAHPPTMTIQNGDIVSALNRCVAVVKGGHDPLITNEVIAVALIVHLVGDIHQPLHCTTHYLTQTNVEPGHRRELKDDGGGNAVVVRNFKNEFPNLHEFWDVAYKVSRATFGGTITAGPDLETFQTTPAGADVKAATTAILKFAPAGTGSSHANFEQWARETHALGCSEVYGKLSKHKEGEAVKLSAAYVKNARRVASEQLCLAGFRLAALLNELYPNQ